MAEVPSSTLPSTTAAFPILGAASSYPSSGPVHEQLSSRTSRPGSAPTGTPALTRLLEAAETSSSEDSQGVFAEGLGQERSRLAAERLAASDSEEEQGSYRTQRHRKHKVKHKHKHSRANKEERKPKQHKTDAEKVAALEAKAAATGVSRRPNVHGWVKADTAAKKDFYVDTRGDKDNVTYKGLYRLDVAAYFRVDPTGVSAGARPLHGLSQSVRAIGAEVDDERQRGKRGKRKRFFLEVETRRQATGHVLRLNLVKRPRLTDGADRGAPQRSARMSLPAPTFIPIANPTAQEGVVDQDGPPQPAGEHAEQRFLRRTSEFNIAVRERPHELQLWLDFAKFQDEAVRASKLGIAEKKVDILESALKHHPGSDELLLQLVDAASVWLEREDLEGRWKQILGRHSGSARLWRAYLSWRATQLEADSPFIIATQQDAYASALQALERERSRRVREGAPQTVVQEAEEALAGLLIDSCRFRLQSGYTEAAVAQLQAALEFACNPLDLPMLPTGTEGERLRRQLFQEYWDSGVPIIGEEGAAGWQAWVLKLTGGSAPDELASIPPPAEEAEDIEEEGGWGGWEPLEPLHRPEDVEEDGGEAKATGGGTDEDSDDASEKEAVPDIEDEGANEEALMQRLNELLAKQKGEGLPAELAQAWLAEEYERERNQWQPLRQSPKDGAKDSDDADGGEAAEGSFVAFDAISSGVFSLGDDSVTEALTMQLLELLGVTFASWQSSNAPRSARALDQADVPPPALAALLLDAGWAAHPIGTNEQESLTTVPGGNCNWLAPSWPAGRKLPARPVAWYQEHDSRRVFVARLLAQLVSGPFCRSLHLCEALLVVEATPSLEQREDTPDGDCYELGNAVPERARETARRLLAQQGTNMALWEAYAGFEARHGQYKAARKVYNTALAFLKNDFQRGLAPPLALALAQMEVAQGRPDSTSQALHVLAWLGSSNEVYKPPGKKADALQDARLIEARRGYQARLSAMLSQGHGGLTRLQAALVQAASLFEELQAQGGLASEVRGKRLAAAIILYDHALAAVPLEVRRSSAVVEELAVQQCRLMLRSAAAWPQLLPPARVLSALQAALQVYPRSTELHSMRAHLELRAHMASRLRLALGQSCRDHPCALLTLLSLKCEACLPASGHRVKTLLNRALGARETAACVLLRRILAAYEASRGNKKGGRDAFVRSFVECPWSKVVLLEGLGGLGDEELSAGQRAQFLEQARDRGVRVRTDLAEVQLAALGPSLLASLQRPGAPG